VSEKRTALVAGGLGLIGRNLVEHLSALDDWDVIAISRRDPDFETRARFLALDLLDRAALEERRDHLSKVTHVFYAAWQPRPSQAEEVEPNLAMLRHVVEVVEEASPYLQHVNFMQGSKAYGAHLGPYKTPAKESDPRHLPPNFYFDQEDFVRGAQQGRDWGFSILRPNSPCGFAVGNPMNLIMVLAVYAAVCRELGLPLRFPGSPETYAMLYEVTDMGLLARAATWAATSPRARNEVFNVSNGDYFRWEQIWPRIAAFFGMEIASPQTLRLSERMADKGSVWQRILDRHGLRPYPYKELVSWNYGDGRLHRHWETLMNTSKIRRHGFLEFVDTEEMFMRIFQDLRDKKVIP
jgi:nucleoside-diphosphate-sugar epimerase